jgi:hypothetical protein
MDHMSEKAYMETLRGVAYLFKEYNPTYHKEAQRKYYLKRREKVLTEAKERYEKDESFRVKMIERASTWNKTFLIRE